MMKKLIKSSRIYTEGGILDGAILVEGSKIAALYKKDAIPADFDGEVFDYGSERVIPGIIDLHTHGFKGWSAQTTDKEQIRMMAKSLPSVGITGFQPTSCASDYHVENVAITADVIDEGYEGAKILGIHMEGPFYNVKRHGATHPDDVKPCSLELMKQFWEAGRGYVTYMTIAAEVPGAKEVIDFCLNKGMVLGIGHSDATYAEAIEAFDNGVKVAIHSFNAMRPIHQREVGLMGAVMLDKRVYNELIPDFYHVCPEMIQILFRMKPYNKILLVSDCSAMSALKPGIYNIDGKININEKSGFMHLEDGTINSSSKYILYGIGNLVEKLGIPLEDVILMSSRTPAEVLGIQKFKGGIHPTKDADIAVIDDNYDCIATFVEGSLEYDRETAPDLVNPEVDKLVVELFD
ncbi:MAG: N-acetylglucosamine-6-phosphate deacetylase [Clostridiales bacterium]|nr:N-acetylglucosamine-6-phosphate deacetylase [Clostridiales bacterium]